MIFGNIYTSIKEVIIIETIEIIKTKVYLFITNLKSIVFFLNILYISFNDNDNEYNIKMIYIIKLII